MRRMLVLMTVMAMMAVMLAMSVAPALASPGVRYLCTGGPLGATYTAAKFEHIYEGLGQECVKLPKE